MERKNTKVVILCGGLGARMKEETEFRPKPLVNVGNKPILWHIMKLFSFYGYRDFILCLGYKGDLIKEYFLKFRALNNDFTINLSDRSNITFYDEEKDYDWNITLASTGIETPTGGRIKLAEKHISTETFFVTYGDGLSDLNLQKLLKTHEESGKIATMTGVHPISRYGVIDHRNGLIKSFQEKPLLDGYINGGFFLFNKGVFNYLEKESVLETDTVAKLIKDDQIAFFKHDGFWRSIDTFKDAQTLNNMYRNRVRPWMIWKQRGI